MRVERSFRRGAPGQENMFEESSIDDLWHCRQVGDLMGGEEFQTLKKIMDTDTYVQEVTTDNEHLVNYFEVSGE